MSDPTSHYLARGVHACFSLYFKLFYNSVIYRIQSSEAKKGDGGVESGSFAARAQAAAAKNENAAGSHSAGEKK